GTAIARALVEPAVFLDQGSSGASPSRGESRAVCECARWPSRRLLSLDSRVAELIRFAASTKAQERDFPGHAGCARRFPCALPSLRFRSVRAIFLGLP